MTGRILGLAKAVYVIPEELGVPVIQVQLVEYFTHALGNSFATARSGSFLQRLGRLNEDERKVEDLL